MARSKRKSVRKKHMRAMKLKRRAQNKKAAA
jgi:hypothetical protein